MDRTTDADAERVLALLRAAGLRAAPIPRAYGRTCDLHAEDGDQHYLVEVKSVHDDEEVSAELRHSGSYDGYRAIGRSAALFRRIERAIKQIRDSAGGAHDDLWLVALVAHGPLWTRAIFHQIIATLYGMGTVVDLGPPLGRARKCLYLRESAFHKHRLDLDGVVILGDSGVGFCLNDHSQRAQRVRLSRLGRFFSEHNLLHDAARLEREGRFLIVDCETDRSEEHAVLRSLGSKHGFKRPVALRSYAFLGAFSVPRGE